MDGESVSYEMLQDMLRTERRTNKLVPVPARFWSQVQDFLEALTREFRAEQQKDPFSRKVMLLTDEVKNARHAAQALWALRERKLAMMALAHKDEKHRPDGMSHDEDALYHALLETLQAHRTHMLGETAPTTPAQTATPTTPVPSGRITASATPGPAAAPDTPVPEARVPDEAQGETRKEPVAVPPDTPDEETVTIRALGDIPPFVGPDMQTYILKEGDLATVPPSIARILEKRKKAVLVDA